MKQIFQKFKTKKSALRNKKGFTLVEMLVMLAVVGLIAGVLFGVMGNVFGDSSIKAAAVQVADGVRQINDAAQNHQAQRAAKPAGADWASLVSTGMLTALPPTPSAIGAPAWGRDQTAAPVEYVTLAIPDANLTVCQKINELYAGAAEGAPVSATRVAGKDLHCYGSAGAYKVEKKVFNQ